MSVIESHVSAINNQVFIFQSFNLTLIERDDGVSRTKQLETSLACDQPFCVGFAVHLLSPEQTSVAERKICCVCLFFHEP